MLKGTNRECNLALASIQRHFSGVRTLYRVIVQEAGKSRQDFEEIASDALLALALNVKRGKFKNQSSLNSYFTSIGLNIWKTKLTRSNKFTIDSIDSTQLLIEPEIEKTIETQYLREIIRKSYSQMTENCKQILIMRFNKGMTVEAMSERLTIAEQSVRNQLSRCRSKLELVLKAHTHV